jgi:hypothetical protein
LDDPARDIGQADLAAVALVDQPPVVATQRLMDACRSMPGMLCAAASKPNSSDSP